MKSYRTLGIALLAALATCALLAASASASLPTLLFLSGETTEVTAEGKTEGAIKTVALESELGEEVPGTGVVLKLGPSANDTHLGKYTAQFKGVEFGKEKCNNVGATKKTGIVEVTGNEYHLVYVSLSPSSPLAFGFLFLVAKFEWECGAVKITSEGLALANVTKNAAKDVEALGGSLKCTKPAKPELTVYENEKGESVKALLKSNLGLGNELACERAPEIELKFSHMVTIDL